MNLNQYLNKMRGSTTLKHPNINWLDVFWSYIGGFLGMAAIVWLDTWLFAGTDLVLVIGSFGASSVLAYGAIQSPLAQPRNLVGGHIVSAIAGVACYKLFYAIPWLAAATSVATAIVAMQITRTIHPPGGATALIAVIGSEQIHRLGWLYVLIPATLGSSILLIVALLINNIPRHRHYPTAWN